MDMMATMVMLVSEETGEKNICFFLKYSDRQKWEQEKAGVIHTLAFFCTGSRD